MTCGKANWELLLGCAQSLTAAGKKQFTRRDLIESVQRTHPRALDKSLNPTIQGMTINASGGPAVGCGPVFRRIDRGLYELLPSDDPAVIEDQGGGGSDAGDQEPVPHGGDVSGGLAANGMLDPTQPWDWEGNVQQIVAGHLIREGWRIVGMADTAAREQGVDLEARRGEEGLLVEVKGYPQTVYARGPKKGQPKPTNPATQARHWYASALLTAMLQRERRPEATIALAFPAYETYSSLVRRTRSSLEAVRLRLFFVTSEGGVITDALSEQS